MRESRDPLRPGAAHDRVPIGGAGALGQNYRTKFAMDAETRAKMVLAERQGAEGGPFT